MLKDVELELKGSSCSANMAGKPTPSHVILQHLIFYIREGREQ